MEIEKGEIITLDNNKQYLCFGRAKAKNQKQYLYLMTITEPVEICFGEEIIDETGSRVRVLGNREEKYIALEALKEQAVKQQDDSSNSK